MSGEEPRYELIEGELCETEAPTDAHKKALRKLLAFIAPFDGPSSVANEPPGGEDPTPGEP
ncbi:hypothetical protein [Polyangium spumosum]|uniref:Uncharacterized protein n=1 Tax=Polyangium spumosum TaxID=889282 RepID=A0A6N7Q096_9BACT|nr:hypothetical protein [Polyangium spumosum]MRG95955.1 hypothetical protein [Polyangium spumosum]